MLRPDEALHGREIARRTGLAAGTITRELTRLAEVGLLKREKRGNQQLYSADTSGLIFAELASILRAMVALHANGYRTLKSKPGHHQTAIQTAIQTLPLTVGLAQPKVIVLDALRKQRKSRLYSRCASLLTLTPLALIAWLTWPAGCWLSGILRLASRRPLEQADSAVWITGVRHGHRPSLLRQWHLHR